MTHKNMPHEPIGECEYEYMPFGCETVCSCDEVFGGKAETRERAREIRDEAYAAHLKAMPAHRDTLRNGDVE